MKKRRLPPTYFISSLIAIIILHFLLPVTEVVIFPYNLIGIFFLVVGSSLNLVADNAFKKYNTTVKPFEESDRLITEGVFKISRHPMYLGMLSILLGLALLFGSLTSFIPVISFPILIEIIFISVEEKMLAEKFGAKYEEYKLNVRKWI